MSKYTEKEILEKAIEVVRNNPGIRTSELIKKLEEVMKPIGDDLEILKDRNDTKFSQKVRNIVSHRSGDIFLDMRILKVVIEDGF